MHNHKHFDHLAVKKLPGSEAEITGELTLDYLQECRPRALKELNARTDIPGFRKGNIPEEVLVKHMGEMHILEEVSELALGEAYPEILKAAGEKEKISPIGRPNVSITKLAPGIPLEFKITLALEPEFDLPEYKKIAAGVATPSEDLAVTDKEIDSVLEEIKKQNWTPDLKEGENLRDKASENILHEKELRARERRRLTIVEKLVEGTKIEVPKVLAASELEKMMAQFKDDVAQHGLKWEEYLKNIKKTEDDVRREWEEKAVNRAKAELIIGKIAEQEKLEPDPKELEQEAERMLTHYKDADPLRVRIYLYGMMRNEKVLKFLEEAK